MGVGGGGPRQLPSERHGGRAAAAGVGQPAPLREGGHARLPEAGEGPRAAGRKSRGEGGIAMPLSGTLDIAPRLESAPHLDGYDTEAWEIAGVELLSLTFEINESAMQFPLPPALHP